MVFKGGTALKKCWFGDYRFSEDLDFSGIKGVPIGNAMDEAMQGACRAATHLLDEYAPVEIPCRRYAERAPHPGGQEAFTIRARFPWHREPSTRVMIEISVDEKVIKSTPRWSVIHGYDEKFNTQVLVYAMEEIVLPIQYTAAVMDSRMALGHDPRPARTSQFPSVSFDMCRPL